MVSRGNEAVKSPHGIPRDMLDRILIVKTTPYDSDHIQNILQIRAKVEGIKVEEEALQEFGRIGVDTSLRFVCLLGEINIRCKSAQ